MAFKRFSIEDMHSFKIKLTPPSKIYEIQELETLTAELNVIQTAMSLMDDQGNSYLPKEWLYKHISKFNEQEILYDKQSLPVLKKTPKGQPSTAESVLQELAIDYPLPKLILEYRSMSKLKSTYTDKLPQQVSTKTNRVHTSYHQAVAATGRLSSSNPNLQNIS